MYSALNIQRLAQLAEKLPQTLAAYEDSGQPLTPEDGRCRLAESWEAWEPLLRTVPEAGGEDRELFLRSWPSPEDGPDSYMDAVRAFPDEGKMAGTRRLQAIVDSISGIW